MLKVLFLIILLTTFTVNLIFLIETRNNKISSDDILLASSTIESDTNKNRNELKSSSENHNQRRIFSRSNDFYSDYSSSSITLAPDKTSDQTYQIGSSRPLNAISNDNVNVNVNVNDNDNDNDNDRNDITISNAHNDPDRELSDEIYIEKRRNKIEQQVNRETVGKFSQSHEPKLYFKLFKQQQQQQPSISGNSLGSDDSYLKVYETNKHMNIHSDSSSNVTDNKHVYIGYPLSILSKSLTKNDTTNGDKTISINNNNSNSQINNNTSLSLKEKILRKSIDDHHYDLVNRTQASKFNVEETDISNTLRTDMSHRWLNIRVKSSKSHVFVSVDNIIIYESKSQSFVTTTTTTTTTTSRFTTKQQQQQQQFGSIGRRASSSGYNEFDNSFDGRGIHVVVLNQFDGEVMSKRVYDTYSPNQDEELCFHLNMIRDGRIVIMAVRDEATFKMSPSSAARKLIQKLGSRHIMDLRWRDMWALVFIKRTIHETGFKVGEPKAQLMNLFAQRSNLAESLSKSPEFNSWASPVIIETKVELSNINDERDCRNDWLRNGDNQEQAERRQEFCSKLEGYGRICDCFFPAPISFKSEKIKNSKLDKVPIVVIASNRPYYLMRMLRSLLSATGINKDMITIFIDGFYEEPMLVSRLFNIRAIQQKPIGSRGARISHHYKTSLTKIFEMYPKAEYAIIFEEDLDISKDALIYFNQTLDLLNDDPSLYCISAWNDQGYDHTSRDNKLLYRIETMPGLGWVLKRSLYKDELEPNWPSPDKAHDWDMWIRMDSVRKNRECIIPDVSRTFHFGSRGTNINSFFQRQYFSKHAFNLLPIDGFSNLETLKQEAYERMLEKKISEARVLNYDDNININNNNNKMMMMMMKNNNNNETEIDFVCSLARTDSHELQSSLSLTKHEDNILNEEDTNIRRDSLVIYIEMIDKHDYTNWLSLASCWHIWDLDSRGQHNSMWRLFLNKQPTMVIGVPASPYSRFKPDNVRPISFAY